MEAKIALGRAIKARRSELGLSQEELANATSMSRSFVSGVERGERQTSPTSLWRLSVTLKCRPSELWSRAEKLMDEA